MDRTGSHIAAIEECHEDPLTVLRDTIVSHLHDGRLQDVSVFKAYRQQRGSRDRFSSAWIPDSLRQKSADILDDQGAGAQLIDCISDDFDKKVPRVTATSIGITLHPTAAANGAHALAGRTGCQQIGPVTAPPILPSFHDRRQSSSKITCNTRRRPMI
jgi:hypothetical protein